MPMSETRNITVNGVTFLTWMDYEKEQEYITASLEGDQTAFLQNAADVLETMSSPWEVTVEMKPGEGFYKDQMFTNLTGKRPIKLSDEERKALGKPPKDVSTPQRIITSVEVGDGNGEDV